MLIAKRFRTSLKKLDLGESSKKMSLLDPNNEIANDLIK